WQTEQMLTSQMATWREWCAWRREFKSLGIRQVKEREAHSIWHEEKQQAARWWLREWRPLPKPQASARGRFASQLERGDGKLARAPIRPNSAWKALGRQPNLALNAEIERIARS